MVLSGIVARSSIDGFQKISAVLAAFGVAKPTLRKRLGCFSVTSLNPLIADRLQQEGSSIRLLCCTICKKNAVV